MVSKWKIQNKNVEIQQWPRLMQSANIIPIAGPLSTNIIEYVESSYFFSSSYDEYLRI